MSQPQTKTWKSQSGYIWSLIGSAVGFANILSFSAQVYINGGGAFLIPYIVAIFLLGVPMLMLEGLIGYKWKLPIVSAYNKVLGNKGKVLGWLSVIACLTIGAFYIVLTSYSAAYTYFSATRQIPPDSKAFFLNEFLKTTESVRDFGAMSIPVLVATVIICILTYLVMIRNIRDGIEKVCTLFMPLLAFIMTAFAVSTLFLPGGINALEHYLKPDFSKLSDPGLWRDVFGQLFFSLSLGLGIIVGYSRHTDQKTNVAKAMFWVTFGDFAVSFISGLAIFGCLAHISHTQQIPFDQILVSDSTFEIGFILFPKILQSFGENWAQIVGTIFFFCIFIAGITGVFSIAESIVGNFEHEFTMSRKKAVSITMSMILVAAVIFCFGNASHIIDALAPMVLGINMLIGGIALIITFQYLCPATRNDPLWYRGNSLTFFGFSLRYVGPILLILILLTNLWYELHATDISFAIRWTWFALALISSIFIASKDKHQEPALRS
ncbi:MAG: sodium-dependent transporter [Chlamydiales bacterium 38-26]|mgnify:CR=1 FL=1|nr:sodium-dependent transporter [Chlamydiales bacterium]OJV08508.1 MAG: sodium-dependent transporter [Chlamydiales bacterium 38-26]